MKLLAKSLCMLAMLLAASVLTQLSRSFAGDAVIVTDVAKRTVNVPKDPKKIICLAPGALRLICYLGAQDRLVGVEQFEKTRPVGRPYWLANPQLAKLPQVGPGGPKSINSEPDLEAILRVKPDVIFVTYMKAPMANSLQRKLRIPVVVLSYGGFATFDPVVYESLKIVGKVLGKEQRAEEVVAFIEGAREDLLKRVEGVPDSAKPTVYIGGIGYKGFQGIESTDANYVPLDWVKARNVAKSLQKTGHLFIDKEKLMSWSPRIVFVDGGGLGLLREDHRKKPSFYQGLKAVKDKSVFLLLPFNWYMTNIGTAIADAYACGKILYPEKFADIDLPQKADAIYTFFVGKPVYQMMKRHFGELGGPVAFP
jgi:iron complex transport system substrate-binding protein